MLRKMREIGHFGALGWPESTPELICSQVAQVFHVRETEVALLELHGRMLNFLYPAELKTAGAIPLASESVAARTVRSNHAELFNGFAEVKHYSIFELVKLGDTGLDEQVIQKLMSAPVVSASGEVVGVIQVSRKAPRPAAAGPDFTAEDLEKLESVARAVGKVMGKDKGVGQSAG